MVTSNDQLTKFLKTLHRNSLYDSHTFLAMPWWHSHSSETLHRALHLAIELKSHRPIGLLLTCYQLAIMRLHWLAASTRLDRQTSLAECPRLWCSLYEMCLVVLHTWTGRFTINTSRTHAASKRVTQSTHTRTHARTRTHWTYTVQAMPAITPELRPEPVIRLYGLTQSTHPHTHAPIHTHTHTHTHTQITWRAF